MTIEEQKMIDVAKTLLPDGYVVAKKSSCGPGPVLLTMGEVCDLLGISRATLWRMVRAGGIEKTEIYEGAFRIKRSEVEKFL
jgi:excisionase family DNA binding protein